MNQYTAPTVQRHVRTVVLRAVPPAYAPAVALAKPRLMTCLACGVERAILSGQLAVHCCTVTGTTYTAHNVADAS